MSEFDDGGSAFPEPINAQCGGMTLRDYFIAHAPTEPAGWFQPVMTSECPEVEADEPVKRWWHFLLGNPDAGMLMPRFSAARWEWRNEYRKQSQIQWPAAWADQMLIQRNKESAK